MNYSTAKTILRIFRLEKRILKKKSLNDDYLKDNKQDNNKKFHQTISNKKKEFNQNNLIDLACESIPYSSFLTNNSLVDNPFVNKNNNINISNNNILFINKHIKEAFPAFAAEANLLNMIACDENGKGNSSLAVSRLVNEPKFEGYSQLINPIKGSNNNYNNKVGVSGNNKPNNNFENINSENMNSRFSYQTDNLNSFMILSQKIQNLNSMISVCYENLKFNQNMISLIMNQISNGS